MVTWEDTTCCPECGRDFREDETMRSRIAALEAFVGAWDAFRSGSPLYDALSRAALEKARAAVGNLASERERRGK